MDFFEILQKNKLYNVAERLSDVSEDSGCVAQSTAIFLFD